MINKIHFTFDSNKKNKLFKKKILNNYKNFPPHLSHAIVVVGGDGFMLHSLKKYKKYNKPFYGMNTGSVGFLMNKFKHNNLKKYITSAKTFFISPLQMNVLTKNNEKKKAIAINEASLLRQSRQTSSLKIYCGKKILIKKLICDGVLVCTPAGSTAYNLSINGPILSLNSKKIAITPISPFRPRRWKGKIVKSNTIVKVINLNIKKRPVSAVADNVEFRNIKSLVIKVNKSIKFKLLYDKNNGLTKKIKLEQLKNR